MKRIIELLKKAADAVVRAYSWITGFGADKYMHVIAGMAVTAAFALVPYCAPVAFTAGVLVGAGKEYVDMLRGGAYDKADLAASVVGAVAMQLCLWLYLITW